MSRGEMSGESDDHIYVSALLCTFNRGAKWTIILSMETHGVKLWFSTFSF